MEGNLRFRIQSLLLKIFNDDLTARKNRIKVPGLVLFGNIRKNSHLDKSLNDYLNRGEGGGDPPDPV